MLREIDNVKQIEGAPFRRWFANDILDLYVWYGEDDAVIQFQICFDKGQNEQALTWSQDQGFFQTGVDDGEGRIMKMKSTPVLTEQITPDIERAEKLIEETGQKLEHDLYQFIMTKLSSK